MGAAGAGDLDVVDSRRIARHIAVTVVVPVEDNLLGVARHRVGQHNVGMRPVSYRVDLIQQDDAGGVT